MNDSRRATDGWERAALGDLFEIKDRERIPINGEQRASRPGTIPYYGATGQVGWIDDYIFDEELVLLGEDGAPFLERNKAKAYVIRGKAWVNNHAHVLRALASTPSVFWKFQLDQVDYHGFVSGTTRLKLSQMPMRQIPLLVPPCEEQHRIVEAIESYFTRLDDAVATLERTQRNLRRYRASVLKAAVEGRLVPTEAQLARAEGRSYEPASVLLDRILSERRRRWEEAELAKMKAPKDDRWKAKYVEPVAPDTTDLPNLPEGWCWASVDQLTSRITSGSRDWTQYYGCGDSIFLMAQNVRPGQLDLTYRQSVAPPPGDPSCERSQVQEHDLLVTIVGANTGNVCRVLTELPRHYVCQSVALMRFVEVSSHYVDSYLNSPPGQRVYAQFMYGQGRPHLSFDNLRETPVPLPPVIEQARIGEAIERQISVADDAVEAMAIEVARCNRLRQSLLKWAFEGRLVDQDPTDEPASRLLERIRAARESANGKPARSPRRERATTKVRT